jgi:hypothetical protein
MERELQEQVWLRAGHRCEYCNFPAQLTRVPFQIDHIIAEKHGGQSTKDNLALSCLFCNTYKGPNIAGIDPDTGALTRLFHPRKDLWVEHFRWNGPVLEALTDVGRTTIAVLKINRSESIAVRQSLMEEGVFSVSGKEARERPC